MARTTTARKPRGVEGDGTTPTPIPEAQPEAAAERNGGKGPPDVEIDADDFGLPEEEGAPQGEDDFDRLEDFALPQNFDPGVEEEDPPVSVRKPGPWDFFRVHPDPGMSCNVGMVEIQDERDEPYLIKPEIFPVFGKLVSRRRMFVYKTMQGTLFLWAAKLSEDGRRSGGQKYNETALKAAERAKSKWTRMQSDQDLKAYRIFGPGEEFPDPAWPNTTLNELMRKAFGDGYLVKDANHPLVRRIKGLAK